LIYLKPFSFCCQEHHAPLDNCLVACISDKLGRSGVYSMGLLIYLIHVMVVTPKRISWDCCSV